MEQSIRTLQQTDDRSMDIIQLRKIQSALKEHSKEWYAYQHKIDQKVAQKFLEYMNS